MSILFVSKTTVWCKLVQQGVRFLAPDATIVQGERTDALPESVLSWRGKYIISFLSPWIIPENVLNHAKAAINFHPGPPEWPGIGCYNFALYAEVPVYGVTCHYMAARVDSGSIIRVLRFPVFREDTVASLKDRSMAHLVTLFHEIAPALIRGGDLPACKETWGRKPYTRTDLDALCRITLDMSDEEIQRRARATFYPGYPGPYVEVGGLRFEFVR